MFETILCIKVKVYIFYYQTFSQIQIYLFIITEVLLAKYSESTEQGRSDTTVNWLRRSETHVNADIGARRQLVHYA